jgi:hypothetical protein
MRKKSSTAVDLFNDVTVKPATQNQYVRSFSNKSQNLKDLQRKIAVNNNLRALADAEI